MKRQYEGLPKIEYRGLAAESGRTALRVRYRILREAGRDRLFPPLLAVIAVVSVRYRTTAVVGLRLEARQTSPQRHKQRQSHCRDNERQPFLLHTNLLLTKMLYSKLSTKASIPKNKSSLPRASVYPFVPPEKIKLKFI